MTDQEFTGVLARAREGDNAAMTRLIEEYEPQVLLVARKRLGAVLRAAFDSADLTQSVHRSLLFHLRRNQFTFDSPKDLIALAVDMVKKKAAKKAGRLKRERDHLEILEKVKGKLKPEGGAAAAQKVHDLLEALTDSDRRFLQLHLEGYSTAEIADQLQCNPDSLRVRRSRLFRGLRAAGLEIA